MHYQEIGCDRLIHAIVMQAVKDYRHALRKPFKPNNVFTMQGVEKFIKSKWFKSITMLDPDVLLSELQKERTKAERRFIEHEQVQILRWHDKVGKDNKR